MRKRPAVVAVGSALVVALIAWFWIGRDASTPGSPRSVVPWLFHRQPAMHLVVGDTVPINVRTSGAIGFAPSATDMPRSDARLESDGGRVVMVLGDSAIVALASGVATITATGRRAPGVRGSMRVEVMTVEHAVNKMAAEMCVNEEGRLFRFMMDEQPVPLTAVPIHEFNDCQRLIIRNGNVLEYLDVAGIFAEKKLAQWNTWEDFRDGPLVATVFDTLDENPEGYPTLGVVPGRNCLYLRAVGPDTWYAAIVKDEDRRAADPDFSPTTCKRTSSADVDWSKLEVKSWTGVDLKGERLAPPAARWDWDEANGYNYIGVKCGEDRWCEIGKAGAFTPSEAIRHRPSGSYIIKGYYDQQYLSDAEGKKPTTVFGTIVPDTSLWDPERMKHADKKWYAVAHMTFRESTAEPSEAWKHYARAYTGKAPPPMNSPRVIEARLRLFPNAGEPNDKAYRARLGASDTDSEALKSDAIRYVWHARPARKFATARWRWAVDEFTWSYCDPDGCCDSRSLLLDNNLFGR